VGIVRCPNPRCITNTDEPVTTVFNVIAKTPPVIKCYYCGREVEEIAPHIL